MKNKKMKKGFTLVELLVVIAILAILASVSVVGYIGFTEKAKKSVDEQLCAQYNTLLQATAVEKEDISLPELVTLIEENGIRANQFRTVSKSYVFAYNRKDKKCVLLDKESGKVLYPENTVVEAKDLWSSMDTSLKLQKGVKNYAFFQSITSGTLSNDTESEYNFDLNHHAVKFAANPRVRVNLKNGSYIKDGTQDNIVVDSESVDELDSSSITELSADKTPETAPTTNHSISEKYYASKKKWVAGEAPYQLNVTAANANTTVTIEDCVFDNVEIIIGENVENVVINNCTFYNNTKYIFETGSDKLNNLTLTNNKIIDCIRGFSFDLPRGKTTITGNEFTLSSIITLKDERKDNAIQFTFDDPTNLISNWNKESYQTNLAVVNDNMKVEIKNNIIHKALGFISIHDGWGSGLKVAENATWVVDHLLVQKHFDISNNTIEGSASPLVEDPGAEDSYKDKTEEANMFNALHSVANRIKSFIK